MTPPAAAASSPAVTTLPAAAAPMSVTAPSQPLADFVADERVEAPPESRPRAALLFRSGGGLHVPLETGPDGTIYVTTRYGYLDVLEPDGRLRFSVTLGGIASGSLYVDARGSVFVATRAGTVLGFDAKGRKSFHYRPPIDIDRGLSFGEGVGLLVRGPSRVVLGINRVGVPVYRFEAPADLSTEPLGFSGFCVVATVNGKLYTGNRALQRKPLTFTSTITAMQTTLGGRLWVRTEQELVALEPNLNVAFRRPGIERFYAFRREDSMVLGDGFIVDASGVAHRLRADGETLGTLNLRDGTSSKGSFEILAGDGEGGLFATRLENGLVHFPASGPPIQLALNERPVGARLDLERKRLLVGTSEGGIYAVTWRPPAH